VGKPVVRLGNAVFACGFAWDERSGSLLARVDSLIMAAKSGRRRARRSRTSSSLSDLPASAGRSKDHQIRVVIETPKGCRNKFAYDPSFRTFELKKTLPAGMAFPYDFGFVPSTLAADGDPLDVLVLMEEPAFPGCLVRCRLLGAILGEQEDEDEGVVRNDRLVAVEAGNERYNDFRRISDLSDKFLEELEAFFVNYHQLSGKKYRIIKTVGPNKARKLTRRLHARSATASK
jgi:inorganic pyrophosphatase